MIFRHSEETGGMNIKHVSRQDVDDVAFNKCHMIPSRLREFASKVLGMLLDGIRLLSVDSFIWVTFILTALKRTECTPVCVVTTKMTLNTYIQLELENSYIQIPIVRACRTVTTINTPFWSYQFNCLPFRSQCLTIHFWKHYECHHQAPCKRCCP